MTHPCWTSSAHNTALLDWLPKIETWNGHVLVTQSFRWILGANLECAAQSCWDKCLKMSENTMCFNSVNEYRSLCVPCPPTCLGVKLKI